MSKRRMTILRIAFWAGAAFALVMALIPHPLELPGEPSDKVQHIAAFLTLGALGSFAYPKANPLHLGAGLSLFGAAIEVLQLIPTLHRDGDPLDWAADTAAVALIIVLLRRLIRGPADPATREG
jgi:peptidoglycan/LPS O-acetylase OafA/YrhL